MKLTTFFLKKLSSYFILVLILYSYSGFSQDDFETWPLSFDVTDSGITVTEETTIVDEGDSSASVEVTTTNQSNTDWRKNINLTSGVTYTISFKIYHTEGTVRARIYCDGWQNYSVYGTTGSWQTLSYDYTPSSTDSFDIGLSLCNDDPVAGVQVQISDSPDQLGIVDVVATDRLEDMTLSWSEQADGSFIIVVFSLTGDDILPGSDPIATL